MVPKIENDGIRTQKDWKKSNAQYINSPFVKRKERKGRKKRKT